MPAYSEYSSEDWEGRVEVGARLRAARKAANIRQAELATRVGTTATTVSLLERGKRAVSPQLLERLVVAVGADPGEIFKAVGTIPPGVARDLLAPDLGHVLSQAGLDADVRWEIRKLRLSELARGVTAGQSDLPVDLAELLRREFQLTTAEVTGLAWPRFTATSVDYPPNLSRTVRQRQLAHMVGHAMLASIGGRVPWCHRSEPDDEELEAEWLGGLVALPRLLLRRTFPGAAATYLHRFRDHPPAPGEAVEDEALQAAAADIAGRFAVPLWMAIRHIADEGLLESAFGDPS